MRRFVDRARALALAWGAPGLFVVAFLDSSFLPLPGITDFLLIVMVTKRPDLVLLYIAGAVGGSVGGCLLMHTIGRKGGEALVRRRFAGDRVERGMATLRRYGVMSVLIPSLLPPPAPFKIFVLLAGVVGISAGKFATAIALGRAARYAVLGWLAVRYGNKAATYLVTHGTAASLTVIGILSAGFAAYLVWTRIQAGENS
jgi:membrane protein YqaA with SNARE-associated domain